MVNFVEFFVQRAGLVYTLLERALAVSARRTTGQTHSSTIVHWHVICIAQGRRAGTDYYYPSSDSQRRKLAIKATGSATATATCVIGG